MSLIRPNRLAAWAGATFLMLLPGPAPAQDGQREVGPPVTTPPTDKRRETPSTFVPPRVGSEVLTPVPATATDPAPPGTRVERVDGAGNAPGTTLAPRRGPSAPGSAAEPENVPGVTMPSALPAGVQAIEGVITGKIGRPGKDLPDEQVRFTLDPSHNWAEFALPGSVASRAADSVKDKAGANPVDVVVTRRTALYTYARTPDGQVVPDPTNPNAPDTQRSRTGVTGRADTPPPLVAPTNFTVLRPGQFVAVQFRKAGNLNEAAALAVIVRPTPIATGRNTPAVVRPGATGVNPGIGTAEPGIRATPAPGADPAPGTTRPGRVPRIPATPAGGQPGG